VHSVPTRRVAWAELLAHPDVEERSELAGRLGLMAFHGGLEAGTAEIAEAAAGFSGASLYLVRQPTGLRWHVPSSSVRPDDSPALKEWLDHVDVAVALHGYGRIRQPRRILLGGANRELAARLGGHLASRLPGLSVVTDLDDIPVELRGLHPANPVNLPADGGVQVELPPSARDRRLDPDTPDHVASALADLARSWTATILPPGTRPGSRSTHRP
jgi:phage replication-related protein YjqB (UPF0714/DUF867 family)